MNERAFNDAILKSGTIPIEYLRATMQVTPLTRETKPTWRFAE
jgi:hypothetical protein